MNQSRRAARMGRHHKRRGVVALSLTSMMDIFTILVFFLLVNSGTEQQLPSNQSVELPQSLAQQLPKDALIVMVSKDDIIVQGRRIMSADAAEKLEDDVLPALLQELKLQSSNRLTVAAEERNPAIVMGDKTIPYRLLRKIMYTLSEANYTDISLAVMKKEKPVS
ncbi:ExbD/TolR family protein [Permianibacter aggregans]|uniref:Biopolymer transport protein ExbD n=1 Tax=Permianibacter aggregans TaxID=1510150 RepID=A0A4R6UL21_9GAMM|nr:biopolymer transporter ExbD [Permianibacter aggregans]QGX41221.1 biopolymer transporter ExbD [Permianibacter aggregans]TDQ45825.1 biopolymer transport protein ExbD [Permianibacter aggregans]